MVEAYKSVSKMLESPNLPEEKRAPGLPAATWTADLCGWVQSIRWVYKMPNRS